MVKTTTRRLGIILGDQLDLSYTDHLGLDRDRDCLLMMEVRAAATEPVSHVQRAVLFLSAMRHHAQALREQGWRVEYVGITEPENTHSFKGEVTRAIERLGPESVACIEPGAFGVRDAISSAANDAGVELEFFEDPHFLCSGDEFNAWAKGRQQLTMEYFYRAQRKKLGVLMDDTKSPTGGAWNFDKENRKSFKRAPSPPPVPRFEPDATTRSVIDDVGAMMPGLAGSVESFAWPVTREQALACLADFIEHRLKYFGDYQDAMWTGEHTLFHSVISPAMNLKLLNPREVYQAAVDAYEAGNAPINAVEGFVRQVIGWREFIRGIYFHQGRSYETRNELDQHGTLPEFYWTGDTDMNCMKHALASVLELAYGHHIARLMVTGNFALIAGVHPGAVNDWYLGMYADAVEWVTTPNTLGMAMHADGGVVGTKPYAASGKYINRMSNMCKPCRYDVNKRTGDDACPYNTFYWDFLIRNRERFQGNNRMALILKNVERMTKDERVEITISAMRTRESMGIGSISA